MTSPRNVARRSRGRAKIDAGTASPAAETAGNRDTRGIVYARFGRMPVELPVATVETRRRPLGFEMIFVILVAAGVLLPGIWRYSLVDPWETHYGEVARMIHQQHDWVHTEWPQDGEGFRSKPILQFWMMAAS